MKIISKELAETPLQSINRARALYSIPLETKMTYAGRLDPMATGTLILLEGDECKSKDLYSNLSKEYTFSFILGVCTDSLDLLGIPNTAANFVTFDPNRTTQKVDALLEKLKYSSPFTQAYPAYSSKTSHGKQLHSLAKQGQTPSLCHKVSLTDYRDISFGSLKPDTLLEYISTNVTKVIGDFRQQQTIAAWSKHLTSIDANILKITVTVNVSSGFYIRQLVSDIGDSLRTPCCVYSIHRNKIYGQLKGHTNSSIFK